MIDRENLKYYENILSIENQEIDFKNIYNTVTAIKENDYKTIVDIVLSNLNSDIADLEAIKSILVPLLFAIKENDEYGFLQILLENTTSYNFSLLENVLSACKHHPDLKHDILDSFSDNQFRSKNKLLELISMLPLPSSELDVILFGSWYGSILIPGLEHRSKRISCIDLDEQVLKIAKNEFFGNNGKLDFITGDVFDKDLSRYSTCDLFVNTSCEHMKPMREWPYWQNCKNNSYFAFQSNNMYDIEGHVNCVHSIAEFKAQLPDFFEVYAEEEIEDSRGTRFCLVGTIA